MPGTVFKGDLAEVSFATETGFTLKHGTDSDGVGDANFAITGGSGSLTFTSASASGVLINNGGGYSSSHTGAMTVDGTNATTRFVVGDTVLKADGTVVGVVTAVGATSITMSAGTQTTLADNDELHISIPLFAHAASGNVALLYPKDMLVGSQFVLTGAGEGDNAADGRVFTVTGNDAETLTFTPAPLSSSSSGHFLHMLPYKTPPVDAANHSDRAGNTDTPSESVLTDQFLGVTTALTLPETKVDLKRLHVVGLGRDVAVQVPGKFVTEGGSFEVAMHTGRWLKYCLGNEISVPSDIAAGTHKTTLSSAAEVGATSIVVASTTDFAIGKYIGIQPASGTVPVVLDHEPTHSWNNAVTDRDFDQATPYQVRRIVGVRSATIYLDEPLIYATGASDKVFLYDYNAGEAPTINDTTLAITKPVTHLLFARSHTPSFSLEVSQRRLDKDADTTVDGGASDAKTLTRVFRGCKVTDFTLSTDNDAALRLAVNFNAALCYTDAGRLEGSGHTDRYNPHRLFDDTASTSKGRLQSGIGKGTQKPFMFYDGSINIAGVQAGKVLNFSLSGQTGMQGFHTINGSTQNSGTADAAVPFGGSRNTAVMVEGKTTYELSLEVMVDDPLFFNKMRSATEFSVHGEGVANSQIVIDFEKPLGNTASGNSQRLTILIDEYYIVEAPVQIPEDKGVVKSQLKVLPKSMRVLCRDSILKY